MFRRLFPKVALVLVGLYAIIGFMFGALIYYSSDLYHQELYQKLNRSLAAQIVDREELLIGGRPDAARLESLFNAMASVNPGVDVYLLDAGGGILAHSVPESGIQVESVDTTPIRKMLAGDPFPLSGEDPIRPEQGVIFSASSITDDGELTGYLYLVLTGAKFHTVVDDIRHSHALTLGVWSAGTALVSALVTALIISALLTRRLRRLADAAERFRTSTQKGAVRKPTARSLSE
ncbi:MAG: hypothetical protein U5R46_03705 [Gammaproteobacteria bacterium]|nr:hypothetical protein [Gammaproteobacteria bacterium]